MSTQYNRTIKAIVIHHMGDGLSTDVSILNRWNPPQIGYPNGYDYPEYDFGIEADGTIREGRPLNILGSHTKSDKYPYSTNYGTWWFNKNSIGIGIAGDFTKFPMPIAQFDGLVKLVKELLIKYNLTIDNVYPHGQVTSTDCPGCTYSKVPELTGCWNYDEFESAVLGNKQDGDNVKTVVVYYSSDDYSVALIASNKNGGIAMFNRNRGAMVHADAMAADKVINIGGPRLDHPNEVYWSGLDAGDTALIALNGLKGVY